MSSQPSMVASCPRAATQLPSGLSGSGRARPSHGAENPEWGAKAAAAQGPRPAELGWEVFRMQRLSRGEANTCEHSPRKRSHEGRKESSAPLPSQPAALSGPRPGFVSKVLLEHSHVRACTVCLWLLPTRRSRVKDLRQRPRGPGCLR